MWWRFSRDTCNTLPKPTMNLSNKSDFVNGRVVEIPQQNWASFMCRTRRTLSLVTKAKLGLLACYPPAWFEPITFLIHARGQIALHHMSMLDNQDSIDKNFKQRIPMEGNIYFHNRNYLSVALLLHIRQFSYWNQNKTSYLNMLLHPGLLHRTWTENHFLQDFQLPLL